MRTSFDEGKSAGYVGVAREKNPYRKGVAPLLPAVAEYASDWDSGHAAGEALARADLMDKRRESCR